MVVRINIVRNANLPDQRHNVAPAAANNAATNQWGMFR